MINKLKVQTFPQHLQYSVNPPGFDRGLKNGNMMKLRFNLKHDSRPVSIFFGRDQI